MEKFSLLIVALYTLMFGSGPARSRNWSWVSPLVVLMVAVVISNPARAQAPPPCLPNILSSNYTWGPVPLTVSSRYDTYGIYVCETPSGYITEGWLFNLAGSALAFIRYKAGISHKSDADADCAVTCVPATATEDAFLTPLRASFTPLALVAFNGSSLTRPVYTTNADGTLNPTPVSGSTVAVAARCQEGNRIITAPSYYSVLGLPDASNSSRVLGNVYTICTVNLPIGSNK